MGKVLFSPQVRPARNSGQVFLRPATRLGETEKNNKNNEKTQRCKPPLIGGVLYNGEIEKTEKPKTLDDLLDQVQHLSLVDRKTLLAKLALSDGLSKTGEGRDLDMWSLALYEALGDVAGKQGISVPGQALIKRLGGVPSAWAPVQTFLRQGKLLDLSVGERQSVYYMLARLLTEHSARLSHHLGIPLSAKFVVGQAQHLASIFEQSFPGYMASGLVPLVARQWVSAKK